MYVSSTVLFLFADFYTTKGSRICSILVHVVGIFGLLVVIGQS